MNKALPSIIVAVGGSGAHFPPMVAKLEYVGGGARN